jgi:hypothetical protein
MAFRVFLGVALLLCAGAAAAQEQQDQGNLKDKAKDKVNQAITTPPPPPAEPSPPKKVVFEWEDQPGKTYLIPALEIIVFDSTLNYYNRRTLDAVTYGSTMNSISTNLHSRWVVDSDPFAINQFWHPVQGTMYYGFARSAGLSPWEAMFYSTGGSALWEIAGETTPPSINDQVASGFGGAFLGEPLFRMGSLILEKYGDGFFPEAAEAAITRTMWFNRRLFGDRFRDIFPARDPATFTRWQLGAVDTTLLHQSATSSVSKNNGAALEFSMAYGLPGKPGYQYARPWDYFNFEFSLSSVSSFENILVRGLIYGTDYKAGDAYRGIWGLYGLYDYLAPQLFRVSTTGLGLGTTGQAWLSRSVALEGTVIGGAGYAAASTTRDTASTDYHYGLAPEGLGTLRLIFGDRFMLDASGRDYYVEGRGGENVLRTEAGLTVRLWARHAIALKYQLSKRNAAYNTAAGDHQTVGVAMLSYTWLGDRKLGAVDWREEADRR